MANEVANIAINANLTANKDSGLGSVKDAVSLAGLGMSKTGGAINYYHSDGNLGNPEVLVLNDASLEDAFGDGITFLTLYGIYIKNNSGATVQIGAGANPIDIFGDKVTDTFELVDGGTFIYLNPTGLTLGADDTLTITGSAGAADIIIIGAE